MRMKNKILLGVSGVKGVKTIVYPINRRYTKTKTVVLTS